MENILNIEQLRGVASRKNKPQEYKSVRNELVPVEVQNGWVVQKNNKTSTRLTRQKNHQIAFEDRVWMLMYRMGFIYMSGQGGASISIDMTGTSIWSQLMMK
jgi:DNA sulfur modification protein DndB